MSLDGVNTWFEIRPTNGSDNNGGGFVVGSTGTDYSQQNSPQFALTGIATAGSGSTFLYSGAASTMVGNLLQVISGTNFTTGFFQIISVSAGVSVTVDRAICTGVGVSGVINIGGALKTFQSFPTTIGSITTLQAYIKAESTITVTSRPDYQSQTYVTFIGYTTTRGDNGQVSITTSNGTDRLMLMRGSGGLTLQNIAFSDTSSTRHVGVELLSSISYIAITNCSFTGHTNGILMDSGVICYQGLIKQVTVTSCTGAGIVLTQFNGFIDDCYVHGNTGDGIDINANSLQHLTISRSVVRANAIGINNTAVGTTTASGSMFIKNCAIVSNSSHGIVHAKSTITTAVMLFLENNIIYGNGGFGVTMDNSSTFNLPSWNQFGACNAFGSNTSGDRSKFPSLPGDVALTANPFTSDSTGDFSLNNTSGGGPVCKAAGFPSTFP